MSPRISFLKSAFAVSVAGLALNFALVSSAAASPLIQAGQMHQAYQPQAPNQSISTTLSQNWAGYIAKGSDYTNITGTWVVPSVTASQSFAADATWVGIGGAATTDLIQAGTQELTENGQVEYQAWYETLPNDSVPVSLTVSPGDTITTTLSETSQNEWVVTILDSTTGRSFATTVNYDSSNSSAEWIEEMPSDGTGYIPLDTFTNVPFTNASAVANGVSENLEGLSAYAVSMVNGSTVLASPGALGADGASFTVTRSDNASSVTPQVIQLTPGFRRSPGRIRGFTNPASAVPSSSTGSYSFSYTNGDGIARIIRYLNGSSTTSTITSSNANGVQTFTVGPFQVQVEFGG